jgi:hypothetical protein
VNWERDAPADADLRLVRPYALTGGRTRAPGSDLPLETLLTATKRDRASEEVLPERREILKMTIMPTSVAEVSAHLKVPIGVARVLVADLVADGFLRAHLPVTTNGDRPQLDLLMRVLDGLQSL